MSVNYDMVNKFNNCDYDITAKILIRLESKYANLRTCLIRPQPITIVLWFSNCGLSFDRAERRTNSEPLQKWRQIVNNTANVHLQLSVFQVGHTSVTLDLTIT